MCLDHFLTCFPWVLYNQALADVRSTGAGTKCLYCMYVRTVLCLAYGSSCRATERNFKSPFLSLMMTLMLLVMMMMVLFLFVVSANGFDDYLNQCYE